MTVTNAAQLQEVSLEQPEESLAAQQQQSESALLPPQATAAPPQQAPALQYPGPSAHTHAVIAVPVIESPSAPPAQWQQPTPQWQQQQMQQQMMQQQQQQFQMQQQQQMTQQRLPASQQQQQRILPPGWSPETGMVGSGSSPPQVNYGQAPPQQFTGQTNGQTAFDSIFGTVASSFNAAAAAVDRAITDPNSPGAMGPGMQHLPPYRARDPASEMVEVITDGIQSQDGTSVFFLAPFFFVFFFFVVGLTPSARLG